MKYHLLTLGCQMNKSDSERTRTVIERMGYTWTDNEEEALMLGVLACSVRQKSIDKVYTRISKWNKWKNKPTGMPKPHHQLQKARLPPPILLRYLKKIPGPSNHSGN